MLATSPSHDRPKLSLLVHTKVSLVFGASTNACLFKGPAKSNVTELKVGSELGKKDLNMSSLSMLFLKVSTLMP